MKTILSLFFCVIFTPVFTFSQCAGDPVAAGKSLKEIRVSAEKKTSFALKIKAAAKNSSWLIKGAEATAITVFVDGKYNQDAFLFAGEKPFEYNFLLGELGRGEHKISLYHNKNLSAPLAADVNIKDTKVFPLESSNNLEKTAIQNSPVIYARFDTIGKFSDIPLVVYYEILPQPDETSTIRYTGIFSNEDGGTQSAALLARWGRLTDIEWIYEIRVTKNGEILEEIYQGASHETKKFGGKRVFGSHPLIFNITVNNNFSDHGCSPMRFFPLPVRANLENGSRETVMDKFFWTYRIMAEEIIREGRVDPFNLGANTVDDPRRYFFVEVRSNPDNAAISLKIEGDHETIYSDSNNSRLRVERKGYFRIAVRQSARGMRDMFPTSITVVCSAVNSEKKGECLNTGIVKIGRLDKNFNLLEFYFNSKTENLKSGEEFRFLQHL